MTIQTIPQQRFQWIPPDRAANLNGLRLPGPLYFHEKGSGPIPKFVIDAYLETRPGPPEENSAKTRPFGYANWRQESRFSFLRWIESGRSDPARPPDSFLWNHYWSLEYRLLVDGDRDPRILSEIGNLLVQHHADPIQPGLAAAITRLFSFYPYSFGSTYFSEFWDWGYKLPGLAWTFETLNVHLAHLATKRASVPKNLAAAICQEVAAQAGRQMDVTQFLQTFCMRFPSGFPVGTPTKVRDIQFHASHPQAVAALLPKSSEWSFTVPDFFAEPSPLAELLSLGAGRPHVSTMDDGFFPEVVVRPGKPTAVGTALPGKADAAGPLVDPNQVAAAEREATEVDSMLAQLMQRQPESSHT